MIALALLAAGVATGHFDVKATPAGGPDPAIQALTLAKTFHGDIDGTSVGEMLATGGPATGAGTYVALERVTATIAGRKGAFTFVHRGDMGGGRMSLSVTVLPGSATGALVGLAGSMDIDPVHDHAYVFRYTLPGR